jgi:predicted dienelactone hydrolase
MTVPGEPLITVLHDDTRPDLRDPSRPRPIRTYTWQPDKAAATVLVSHGTGGSGSEMAWLVQPLIEAGFRVVALDHHGNNFVDGYEPEGFIHVWERPLDVSFVVDTIAYNGPVGIAGFSLGGYTGAAVAGARLNTGILQALWAGEIPLPDIPEFPDVLEKLRAKYTDEQWQRLAGRAGDDFTDSRIRAVFMVAPGVGRFVTPDSLKAVEAPVDIRWGGADTINPYDADTAPYLDLIPTATGECVGPDVRHDDFFEPSPAAIQVGTEAAAFFKSELRQYRSRA